MSGGQAKNILLMELFANVCGMPVVLPFSHSLAVVLGAAMLGRFAHEASREKLAEDQIGERLWNIMVSFEFLLSLSLAAVDRLLILKYMLQVEMTPHGTLITPGASAKERKLLDAKYKIFLESIDIQKRWRKEMEAASK